ncbi:MAG: dihydrodipicolinate synthase family protein [Inquilinaceae bacterium]
MSDNITLLAPKLAGVHAAIVNPMHQDGTLHSADLEQHAASISGFSRIDGLLVNGHAGEGHLLTQTEKTESLRVVRSAVGANAFLTAGVTSEGTVAACEEARAAAKAGADAVLVFPPSHWCRGVDDESVISHHTAIAADCGLPVVLYKAPTPWGPLSYPAHLIEKLIAIKEVVGIKEGSWDVATYEEVWRLVKASRPGVSVMASGDEHLFACFQIGTDGSQVSLAAVAPALVLDLFAAIRSGATDEARRLHDRIYPLAREIYRRAPAYLATARLKAALKLMGRIQTDHVRRPMRQLDMAETEDLLRVLSCL